MKDSGFRVSGLGFRVSGFGFRVSGLGFICLMCIGTQCSSTFLQSLWRDDDELLLEGVAKYTSAWH